MANYYKFIFSDGYFMYTYGLDRIELMHEEQKHGKLISKERA